MPFFSDPKMQDITQGNIKKLIRLEDKEAAKMLESFKKVRLELQDRLLTVPGGTFTEQHLRVTLAQVEAILQVLARRLKTDMNESADRAAGRGVEDLTDEIDKFSKIFTGSEMPVPLNSIMIAMDTKRFLVNRYESSIEAYSEALRQHITQGLTESLIARDNFSVAAHKLQRFFKGEEWKVLRIARTELHNVYNLAKQNGMAELQESIIPDLKKALMHPMDLRTGEDSKALAKENPVVDIAKPFVQKFKGKTYTFMVPPNRPNDRAILIPYREEWNKNKNEPSWFLPEKKLRV